MTVTDLAPDVDGPEEPVWMAAERSDAAAWTAAQAAPSNADDDPEPERTTWWPIDLSAAGELVTPTPTHLHRVDGVALLYAGKVNALNGESESGKTWLTLYGCAQILDAGGHVLMLDFEDDAPSVVTRLTGPLAVPKAVVADRFHYVRPVEPISDPRGRATRTAGDLLDVLAAWPIDLVIIDGVTEAMTLEGLSPLDNADVATWYRTLPRRIAEHGPAVALIDHVTKDAEGRGRYAIGAQHKLAGIDGAAYTVAIAKPFTPGADGLARITLTKDRPGGVRHALAGTKTAGQLHLTDGTFELSAPDAPTSGTDGAFVPTFLMERVSRYLETHPRVPKRQILAEVEGRNPYIATAIDVLRDRGHLTVEQDGRAHLHRIVNPYRETPEP